MLGQQTFANGESYRLQESQQRSSSPSLLYSTRAISEGLSSESAPSVALRETLHPLQNSLPEDAGAEGQDNSRRTRADGDLSPISIAGNKGLERPPAVMLPTRPSNEDPTQDPHRPLTSHEMAVSKSEATLAEASPPTLDGRISYTEHDEQMKLMQQQLVQALAEVQEVSQWRSRVDDGIQMRSAENRGARISEKEPREYRP